MGRKKRIVVLGSTGSIGRSTLDVVRAFPSRFRVIGLSARKNLALFRRQIEEFRPSCVALPGETLAARLKASLPRGTRLFNGASALEEIAAFAQADTVVVSVAGSAGLLPSLRALRAGKRVALATKEAMVMAGALLLREARRGGGEILPVDSEHSALFQCLRGERRRDVKRVILTASGGPFLEKKAGDLSRVSPEEAVAHPRWKMGKKISVDSATMMNKGLEVIEARWFFDLPPDRIEVVIHPESVVHSMVEFVDGSVLSQMGPTDMRIPILYALTYPERASAPFGSVDFCRLGRLTFRKPRFRAFPSLGLAYRALRMGGTAPAVLNAANEVAVEAFLSRRAGFGDIPRITRSVLEKEGGVQPDSLGGILRADARARELASTLIARGGA